MNLRILSHPLVQINLSILFMSTSGVLGRYIQLDSTMTTWWRCFIAASVLLIFCKLAKIDLNVSNHQDKKNIILSGILLAVHFTTYFYALDYSNVAIALLTLYTFPAFTAIIEPIFTRTPFKGLDLLLASCSFLGVLIMVPSFSLENEFTFAIILGLISSVSYVFRNLFLLEPVKKYPGTSLMFYQLVVLVIVISPFWLFIDGIPTAQDFQALLVLGIVTTVLGHTFFVLSLKKLNATTASLLSCLAPVLGIVWAFLLLNEVPKINTVIGGTIIFMTVIIKTLSGAKNRDLK